jgi:hypothetical protein
MKAVLQRTFAHASSDTQVLADQFVQSMQDHDPAAALADIQQLRAMPNLTPDQRTILARALITTTRELQTVADSGDPQAAQAMHAYRVSK